MSVRNILNIQINGKEQDYAAADFLGYLFCAVTLGHLRDPL